MRAGGGTPSVRTAEEDTVSTDAGAQEEAPQSAPTPIVRFESSDAGAQEESPPNASTAGEETASTDAGVQGESP